MVFGICHPNTKHNLLIEIMALKPNLMFTFLIHIVQSQNIQPEGKSLFQNIKKKLLTLLYHSGDKPGS